MRLYGPGRPPQTLMPAQNLHDAQRCSLPWRAIRVTGDDADDFLNGQLTARVPPVDSEDCTLAGYCLPNGRLLALFWLWRDAGLLHLALPADNIEATLARLQMFVLRSDVALTPLDDEVQGLITAEDAGNTPGNTGLRVALADAHAANATEQTWTSACIEAGIASICGATRDQVIPQMIGLEQLGGLDYKKGCYPGQEIIARLHYKGELKQRLYRLALNGAQATPGDAVYADGQTSGVVLDSDGQQALVLARVAHAGSAATLGEWPNTVTLPETAVYPDAR